MALTNFVLLVARGSMAGARPPVSLLALNGVTVTLVIGCTALSGAGR